MMKTCKVCGKECDKLIKGMCIKHYTQLKNHGKIKRTRYDPNEIVEYEDYAEVVLYNKQCEEIARALIDLEDINKVKQYKWSLKDNGYVLCKSKKIRLHRLIMDCPDNMVVDHINHNPLDNRKDNLRICTQHQNSMNRCKLSNNSSGVTGVYWNKRSNKWASTITHNDRRIFLGSFNTKEEAIRARKNAEIEYFGEYRNDSEDVN